MMCLAFVSGVTFVLVCSGLFFPYSGSMDSPKPKRVFLQVILFYCILYALQRNFKDSPFAVCALLSVENTRCFYYSITVCARLSLFIFYLPVVFFIFVFCIVVFFETKTKWPMLLFFKNGHASSLYCIILVLSSSAVSVAAQSHSTLSIA